MDRLVSDLLQMSRIEAGRIQLEKSFVDPALVVEEVTQSFRQAIEEQQQHLAVKVSKRLPTVWADRGRLIQVLSNLISNAHKYTPEGGHITVSVDSFSREGQTYVRWRVADDGIGMSSEQLEQLFTKFFRADNPEVQNVKGTGLGLVITRSLVEMHDGEVSVESEVGKGSTFSFIIPVEEPARPDAGEAES
jgi:signal transduction histidine kinase